MDRITSGRNWGGLGGREGGEKTQKPYSSVDNAAERFLSRIILQDGIIILCPFSVVPKKWYSPEYYHIVFALCPSQLPSLALTYVIFQHL